MPQAKRITVTYRDTLEPTPYVVTGLVNTTEHKVGAHLCEGDVAKLIRRGVTVKIS